jgi:ubiquinone/menaquinone biosynthesis C-methylase UbiE
MHRHRFEAKHHKRLDSAYRRRILPPSTTLKRFGLKRGMVVADIGAGSGYFLIPAARIVGKEAAAYAVDASKEMLAVVESKRPPSNIVYVHTKDGYSFKIETNSVDFVIASAILHENEPVRFLKEIRRIMKPKATLLIIDWRVDSLRYGPPMEERLTPAEVKAFAAKSKLKPGKSVILNSRYYAVIAKKV